MKVPVYNVKGKRVGDAELPEQFDVTPRRDLIKKVVAASWKNRTQPYGSMLRAGRMSSAVFRGTRRGYGHSYNWSVARLPRLMLRGGRRIGRVMNVPQAVGGPAAHPPKVEKLWRARINDKERRLAIRSALAASMDKDIVMSRGHRVPDAYPFLIAGDFEQLSRTKEVVSALEVLGLAPELERSSLRKQRAGKGKRRGRKYKKTKGPLVVVSGKCPLVKAASNIPGVDVIIVDQLNVASLAPGAHPGRLVLFTERAVEKLKKDRLFL